MDNNHLLLLMIHVFRENEEQLFKVTSKPKPVFFHVYLVLLLDFFSLRLNLSASNKNNHEGFPVESVRFFAVLQMVRMSTGHMEGDLQPLYLLLTDSYIYMLRKGEQLRCLS